MSSCLVYLLTLSGTQWTGDWVGPRAGLDILGKCKISCSFHDSNARSLLTVMSANMIHLMTTSSDVIFCTKLRCAQKYTVILMVSRKLVVIFNFFSIPHNISLAFWKILNKDLNCGSK